jgi:hypothetical protein
MPRMLICALMFSACATVPNAAPRDLAECVDVAIGYDPRSEIASEAQAMSSLRFQSAQAVSGQFKEKSKYAFRCPTRRK